MAIDHRHSFSVLLPQIPATLVISACFPCVSTLSVLLVVLILSPIVLPVRPDHFSLTIHLVIFPQAFEKLTLLPVEFSVAISLVISKLPRVFCSISERKHSFALLFALHILPLKSYITTDQLLNTSYPWATPRTLHRAAGRLATDPRSGSRSFTRKLHTRWPCHFATRLRRHRHWGG